MDEKNNGYLVCDKCEEIYEIEPGKFSTDYNDECVCGGKLKYTKSFDASDINNALKDRKINEIPTQKPIIKKPLDEDKALKYKAVNDKIYKDSTLKYKEKEKKLLLPFLFSQLRSY
jgi:hypothetical protein